MIVDDMGSYSLCGEICFSSLISFMKWVVPIIFLIVFEIVADIFAKKWSENQIFWLGFAALFFYLVCNTFWLYALKNGS